MLRYIWMVPLVVACSNGDKGSLTVNNDAPELSIVNPVDNAEYDEYTLIEFRAVATDLEDQEEQLSVQWSSSADGVVNVGSPDANGNIYFATDLLSPGEHVVTLTVTDSQGLSGNTAVSVTIIDMPDAPVIEQRRPTTDFGEENVAVEFEYFVSDEQDAPEDLLLTMTSDIEGEVCTPTADSVGIANCSAVLGVGEHQITLTALDSHDYTTELTTVFTVYPSTQFDNDFDGFTEEEGDCDDTLSTTSPNGVEVPDEIDNDCDGIIDEETDAYDDDGDGYAEMDGDCDDTDATIHPDGVETCDGVDQDCDGVIDNETICFDDDGDGFTEEQGDCNDNASSAYPNGTEVADGIDNDCDTFIDEGTPFFDDDGDCYCESTPCYGSSSGNCDLATLSDGDCDDADDGFHPNATEYCNTLDEDCNGVADDNAVDQSTWYADTDADTRGDANITTSSCYQPTGYVANANDCDDNNPYAWTGNVESCDNYDNDCDGAVDEGVLNTYYLDDDNDGYGSMALSTTACSVPEGYVSNNDDCNDNCNFCHPGMAESCDNYDNDCDGSVDEANATDCVTYYQDLDDDGYGTSASVCTCSPTGDYTTTTVGDCYDYGINASITYPGAPYSSSTTPRGDNGTYDFDCDGTEEKYYTDLADCYGGWYGASTCSNGWYSRSNITGLLNPTVTACGDSDYLSYNCSPGSWSNPVCSFQRTQTQQRCR